MISPMRCHLAFCYIKLPRLGRTRHSALDWIVSSHQACDDASRNSDGTDKMRLGNDGAGLGTAVGHP